MSTSSAAAAALRSSGFSARTCFPARAAASTIARRASGGVRRRIASTPGSASIASSEAAAGRPWRAAKAARRAGSREKTPRTSTCRRARRARGRARRRPCPGRRSRSPAAAWSLLPGYRSALRGAEAVERGGVELPLDRRAGSARLRGARQSRGTSDGQPRTEVLDRHRGGIPAGRSRDPRARQHPAAGVHGPLQGAAGRAGDARVPAEPGRDRHRGLRHDRRGAEPSSWSCARPSPRRRGSSGCG